MQSAIRCSCGNVRVDRLGEDVDLSTAGEAHGEGVVGSDAVTLQRRSSSRATWVASSSPAPSTRRPDTDPATAPLGTDDHRGTQQDRAASRIIRDHCRDARGGTRAPYRHQLVEHITHCALASFAGSPVEV